MSPQSNNTQQGQQNPQAQATQQKQQPAVTAARLAGLLPPHLRAQQNAQPNAPQNAPPGQFNTQPNIQPTTQRVQLAQQAQQYTLPITRYALPNNIHKSADLPSRSATSGAGSILPLHSSSGGGSAVHASGSSVSFLAPVSDAATRPDPASVSLPSSNASNSQAKGTEQSDSKITFFDEQYATTATLGKAGSATRARLNRFQIARDKTFPEELHVYTIEMPQLNGRVVTDIKTKKLLIREAIAATPALQAAFANDILYTDWSGLLVAKQDLVALTVGLVPAGPLQVPLNNFKSHSSNTPVTCQVTFRSPIVLDMIHFSSYLDGNANPDFDFSQYTQAVSILVRHSAAQESLFVGWNRVFSYSDAPNTGGWCRGLKPPLGYHHSVRPALKTLQFQLNTSAAAFRNSDTLIKFLTDYIGTDFDTNNITAATWDRLLPDIRAVTLRLKVRYLYTLLTSGQNSQSQSPVPLSVRPARPSVSSGLAYRQAGTHSLLLSGLSR